MKNVKFILIFALFFGFVPSVSASVLLNENFDGYSTGALLGNGSWVNGTPIGGAYVVTSAQSNSASNSITSGGSSAQQVKFTFPSSEPIGHIDAYQYVASVSGSATHFVEIKGYFTSTSYTSLSLYENGTVSGASTDSSCVSGLENAQIISDLSSSLNVGWNFVSIEWDTDTVTSFRFKINSTVSDWYSCSSSLNLINFQVSSQNGNGTMFTDDILIEDNLASSCTNGILDQDETGIDTGGVCEFLEITAPLDLSTVSDPTTWGVYWSGIDGISQDFVVSVHYSTDQTKLTDCTSFPSGGGAGYDDCINSTPNINVDYSPIFGGYAIGLNQAYSVIKSTPLTLGTTYYAQAVVQYNDAFGSTMVSSDVIEFEVGVPVDPSVALVSCTSFDIFCHLKNAFNWAFVPSQATLNQFSNLTLENSIPFSYLYDMGSMFDELFSNPAGLDYALAVDTGALGTFNLISKAQIEAVPYASTIKTLIGYLLYFFTAYTLYRRLLATHSDNH